MFGKKKKKTEHNEDVLLAKGIYLQQPVMDNGHIIYNCLLRSLIVFLLVFGSVGGFLSAFQISYNYILVIVFYLLLSMYFSFLYAASKFWYRDIGYILFFGIFIAAIFTFRIHANSGFYTIVNTVLQQAQSFFDLSGVREYEVQIANDYLTVAIVSIFVGMVMIIILNIWLYSTMSLIWTVALTFPLLFIPLYMKLSPDVIYILALGTGYLAVVIFKANGHYLAFAWSPPFQVKGLKKDRIAYTQDATIFKQILLRILGLAFCMVILVEAFLPASSFESKFKNDRLRQQTADTIANFILLGFSGMFNHYDSTGGMSGGKLGGISNVRPDYLTDLVVSFAPYSNESVYLKGYTGGIYGDNQWESIYGTGAEDAGQDDIAIFEEESLKKEGKALQKDVATGEEYSAYGVMDVKNVGADAAYLYYPYYTLFEDYSIYHNHSKMMSAQGLKMQQEVSYSYYPKVVWEDSLGSITPSQIDTSQVDSIYMDVPEKNTDVIREECDKIGLTADMTENEIVEAVRDYFADNIPYTLKPGATPQGEDFVNYFLTKNRKGYCAHFATAATLIFREMGIPARYVEGYTFSFETVLASEQNDTKRYGNYYQGYSAIGESTVMDVEVTDAMAHAWVEIYVDGFGWKVAEVTPGSNEAVDEDDFWSAFADFLNGSGEDSGNNGNVFGELGLSRFTWLIYVVLAVIVLLIAIYIGQLAVRKGRRYMRCHQKDGREAAVACYADICDMIRVCDAGFDACRSHGEQLLYISSRYYAIPEPEKVCGQLEQISFGESFVSVEILQEVVELTRQIRRAVWKKEKIKNKIRLCKR
jgi:transglutaminase-like putative cysteine protease